jgi:hypothetical protein
MEAGRADPLLRVASRLEAARLEFDAQTQRFEDASARLRATLDQLRKGRPRREMLRDSAFARLQARLDTMPVIEQAKGVLMAQNQCGSEEAFDLLRRASQRANVKVSVLAAQIVEQIAAHDSRLGDGSSPGRPRIRSVSGSQGHELTGNEDTDSGWRPRRAGARSGR